MSLQEVKDEHKQADGDPQMKGMIRERQLRMSRNRMMADVATADVVLVNPTHVAVALKYDPDQRRAARRRQGPGRHRHEDPRAGARAPRPAGQGRPAGPCRARAPARSATRSRRSSTPPSPASWRSCSRSRPAASPPARTSSRSRAPCAGCSGALTLKVHGRTSMEVLRQDGAHQLHGRSGATARDAVKLACFGQVAVPAAIVSIVLMLVVPLPAVLLDLLLAVNITGSLLILLMSMFVRRPARLRHLPGAAARRDDVPAGAQRQLHPAGPARRLRRQGHRGVRPLRHGRLARRRPGHLPHPGRHPVHGHHQRRRRASPRSAPASPSTRCPASRWPSTPTSTPA